MKAIYRNLSLIIGAAVLMGACNSTKNIPLGSVKTDGLFGDSLSSDTVSMASIPWKELFTDPHLQHLINEGLDSNFDMQVAVQKVVEAEAYLKQSNANFLPAVSAIGDGVYIRNSESLYPSGPRESKYIELGAEANWEIDIWGKLRSAKRASYASLLATDAARKEIQTRLVADIASSYYNLLALDAKLAITKQTVQNNIDLVETMKVLKESGKVTGAAVVQSEATRYAAEVTIPDLEQQIREAQNALYLLLGRSGSIIERGTMDQQPPASLMQIGVPAMLLTNRPDVMQAEYSLLYAYEITKNARAYFYPALTITASSGLAAVSLDELFDPGSFAANIVGGLTQPLFNRRANTTRLKVSKAQQEEALLNFKSTLINAGNEVQNAMGSYQASEQKMQLRAKQVDALVKSVDYSKELLNYGSANYTEVLTAEQSLLSARLSSVNDHLQQLDAVVSLYRALGGGWK